MLQAEKRQRQVEAAERAKRAAAEAQRNLELFRQQNNLGPSASPDAEPNASGAASGTEAQVLPWLTLSLRMSHMLFPVIKNFQGLPSQHACERPAEVNLM